MSKLQVPRRGREIIRYTGKTPISSDVIELNFHDQCILDSLLIYLVVIWLQLYCSDRRSTRDKSNKVAIVYDWVLQPENYFNLPS